VTADESPIYQPGDVVYGDDPYKGTEAGRPWLVISNHEGKPFHGEQYIALSLTTRAWMEGLIEIEKQSWVRGGMPDDSRIIPWAVQSIDSDDIDYWQGSLTERVVTEAIDTLVEYIRY
jgi:mRNA interferase MazF